MGSRVVEEAVRGFTMVIQTAKVTIALGFKAIGHQRLSLEPHRQDNEKHHFHRHLHRQQFHWELSMFREWMWMKKWYDIDGLFKDCINQMVH